MESKWKGKERWVHRWMMVGWSCWIFTAAENPCLVEWPTVHQELVYNAVWVVWRKFRWLRRPCLDEMIWTHFRFFFFFFFFPTKIKHIIFSPLFKFLFFFFFNTIFLDIFNCSLSFLGLLLRQIIFFFFFF